MASEDRVREGFRAQAAFCARNASPVTGRICAALADVLDQSSETGRRTLAWPGGVLDDALPLRLAGAFHALHRAGTAPELAPVYDGSVEDVAEIVRQALRTYDAALLPWLDGPPQTNEVGRAGIFMAGLLAVAQRFGQPIELLELGSSAGLNLNLGRFAYDLGGVRTGDPAGAVKIAPEWRGPTPPDARVEVVSSRGVDVAPVDLDAPGAAERLIAYIWADQPERITRTAAAIDLARRIPPRIDAGDGAAWLEQRLATPQPAGITRVLVHSIVLQYFSDEGVRRVDAAMAKAGAAATPERPLAWLAFESGGSLRSYELRLRWWPGGEERLLAYAHPHGTWIEWIANPAGEITDSLPSWARPGAG